MSTTPTTADQLADLRKKIDEFSEARDWGKFHTPKNLSMALSVEVAELMEHFQWQDGTEAFADLPEQRKEAVTHEVADVFIYLMRLCSVTGIDPLKAAEDKLKLNDAKYPASLVKGKSNKFTDY